MIKLTRREEEVARLIAQGHSNKEIAVVLGTKRKTAEYHVQQILNKLGFNSRTQIAVWVADQRASPRAIPDQRARNNLPLELTAFVGRERELAELEKLVTKSRLLTLTGTGGVGKTRLALKLASNCQDAFGDGVWLVELAPISDGRLIVQAIANATGIREVPNRPLATTLLEQLGQWRVLIVLDNCEHLIADAARLCEQLLTSCPDVNLVVTSREPLRAAGELLWAVPMMEVSTAIELFAARATLAQPDFTLGDSNVPVVSEICRHLDGLPLAIELAAARLSTLSLEEILSKLGSRFQILTGGKRTALPRQQTLSATIDWSYQLLGEEQRILFARLAVFSGGFTAEAAEAVCSGDPVLSEAVFPLLLQLLERSLISPQRTDDGRTRYRLLESLRSFGLERLDQSGDRRTISRRHASYFAALARQACSDYEAGKLRWATPLNEDLDNLRAAFDWSLDADPRQALEMAWCLTLFWRIYRQAEEGRSRMRAALARATEPNPLRAAALAQAAILDFSLGDYAASLEHLNEAETLARTVSQGPELAWTLANCGYVASEGLADLDRAWSLLTEALERLEPSGNRVRDDHRLVAVLNWLGWLAYLRGDLDSALEYANRGLAINKRGANNQIARGVMTDTLAYVALDQRDFDRAKEHFRTELSVGFEAGSTPMVSNSLIGLGHVAAAQLQPERALRLYGAGDMARKLTGTVVPPFNALHASYRDSARNQFGQEAAEAAYQEGAAVPMEDAIAYALADTDHIAISAS